MTIISTYGDFSMAGWTAWLLLADALNGLAAATRAPGRAPKNPFRGRKIGGKTMSAETITGVWKAT